MLAAESLMLHPHVLGSLLYMHAIGGVLVGKPFWEVEEDPGSLALCPNLLVSRSGQWSVRVSAAMR